MSKNVEESLVCAAYVARTEQKGNLWRISISDPGNQTAMWASRDWCTGQRSTSMGCCLLPTTVASTCASAVWNSSYRLTYGGCTRTTSCQAETECLRGTTRKSVPVSNHVIRIISYRVVQIVRSRSWFCYEVSRN
jgi:hypothetical protein